jgi:hypothetical protein
MVLKKSAAIGVIVLVLVLSSFFAAWILKFGALFHPKRA